MATYTDLLSDELLRHAPLVAGFKVLPPCVLIERLDEGAMGAVYRGYHINLEIDVAIKCLKSELVVRNREFVDRFQREAKIAAHITQDNLVRVYDTLQQFELCYTIMEFVDGENVQARVSRKGALDVPESLSILLPTLRAMAALHERKIVHRDIKPPNIMVSQSGQVKLADLGIAKSEERLDNVRTAAQAVMGTPQYMAPEQFDSAAGVNDRADIYAIGAVLGFMLLGDHPVKGKSLEEILRKVVLNGFPDFSKLKPGLPEPVYDLIRRCTASKPEDRPSAAKLVREVNALLTGMGGDVSLADADAAHSLGTAQLPSRLDRSQLDSIRQQLVTRSIPQTLIPRREDIPATLVQGSASGMLDAQGAGRALPPSDLVRPTAGRGGTGRVLGWLVVLGLIGGGAAVALHKPWRDKLLTLAGQQPTTRGSAGGPTSVNAVLPRLSIADADVDEGQAGYNDAVFRLSIDPPVDRELVVQWKTRTGSFGGLDAAGVDDFLGVSNGVLRVPAQATSAELVVQVVGDKQLEPDESFGVEISSVEGGRIERGAAVGRIRNDDKPPVVPSISIADGRVAEGNSDEKTFEFTLSLSAPTEREVTVVFETLDDVVAANAAKPNEDYRPVRGRTVVFAPGQTSAKVAVSILGDESFESDETLRVALSGAVNATIARTEATLTIVNDDALPLPTLSIDDVRVVEGNGPGTSDAVFMVRLSEPTTELVSFDVESVQRAGADVARANEDYIPLVKRSVTVRPGLQSVQVAVPIIGDTTVEKDETFVVVISNPRNARLGKSEAIGTIGNDDSERPPQPPEVTRTFPQLENQARQAATRGDWTMVFARLEEMRGMTGTDELRKQFLSTANEVLDTFRINNPLRDKRSGVIDDYEKRLKVLAEESGSSVAALLLAELYVQYEPDEMKLIGVEDPRQLSRLQQVVRYAEMASSARTDPQPDANLYLFDAFFQVRSLNRRADAIGALQDGIKAGSRACLARASFMDANTVVVKSQRGQPITRADAQSFASSMSELKVVADSPHPMRLYACFTYGRLRLAEATGRTEPIDPNFPDLETVRQEGMKYLVQAARARYAPAERLCNELNIPFR